MTAANVASGTRRKKLVFRPMNKITIHSIKLSQYHEISMVNTPTVSGF